MADKSRRNAIIVVLVVVIVVILLLLTRCRKASPPAEKPGPVPVLSSPPEKSAPAAPVGHGGENVSHAPVPLAPEEVLTPATVKAPERVIAGAVFAIAWTGPDNAGDYVIITKPDAAANVGGHFKPTSGGPTLELTAPIEAGAYEVRYVASRSHTILGRAPVEVVAAGATLDAPASAAAGSTIKVKWTGPDNTGDYITVVGKATPEGQYANYTLTSKGSPLDLLLPVEPVEAELRYMTGQGGKVLARRAISVTGVSATLELPGQAVAGSTVEVTWTGPNYSGDYITVVAKDTPDGQYGNYTDSGKGSPLELLMPILEGEAEVRYVTGQDHKVLARRAVKLTAAAITLNAPGEVAINTDVTVTWTGPHFAGDYITIVPKGAQDAQYQGYAYTDKGSPSVVKAPKEAGECEVRYVSGQGRKVLARTAIQVKP